MGSSSSKSGSGSRDGRGVCGESDSNSSDKSSKSSRSSKSSSTSGDGSRRTDRCFRACDTDRCTSDDRRRLECPASTAASSDFVQKGQASQSSPIQKLVWAAKKGDEGEDSEGGDETDSKKSSDENRNGNSKSSSSKSKSSSSS